MGSLPPTCKANEYAYSGGGGVLNFMREDERQIKRLEIEVFLLRGQLQILVETGFLDATQKTKDAIIKVINESKERFPL